jgi:putative mRNA 3-end processing factor
MLGLQHSLKTCEKVLMTKATKDLIDVLLSPFFLMGGNVQTLDYEQTIQWNDEWITLLRADHILGAAQVLVEDAEGTRIVNTGDFRIDDTPILEADTLVIEATYGSPSCIRSFGIDVRELLVSLVNEGLKQGTVYVFGYHGKLQEIMQILHDAHVKAPFVMPERVFHVSKVCEQHGMRLGRLMLSEENETRELLERNHPCVAFYHMGSKNKVGISGFRIIVSGWEFYSPVRKTASNEYVVALSDHSDFDGLIEYARQSKPKRIITDNYRVGHAQTLADQIQKQLAISTISLPQK